MIIVPLEMSLTIALGKHRFWRHHPGHLYSFSIENLKVLLAKYYGLCKKRHFGSHPKIAQKVDSPFVRA